MARFRGKCGDKKSVGARYGKPMRVTVDVTNKGDCDLRVVLRNGEGIVKKKTIGPGPKETVGGDGVDNVSIKCRGSEEDGECDFTYDIDAE